MMSPSQIHDDQQQRMINGLRPSSLKINKDSHQIQKSSSSSSSSSSGSSSLNGVVSAVSKHHQQQQQQQQQQMNPTSHHQQQQQRHPVIIYTHSPKVIHTEARDFMALVQKLTGLSHSEDHQPVQQNSQETKQTPSSSHEKIHNNNKNNNNNSRMAGHDDTASSSVVTDENIGSDGQVSSSLVSPAMDPINNPYIVDHIPIFTPNSLDFLYTAAAARPFYRLPNPIIQFPNTSSSISHSSSEVTKGSQDY